MLFLCYFRVTVEYRLYESRICEFKLFLNYKCLVFVTYLYFNRKSMPENLVHNTPRFKDCWDTSDTYTDQNN